jgi:hypothetical protein
MIFLLYNNVDVVHMSMPFNHRDDTVDSLPFVSRMIAEAKIYIADDKMKLTRAIAILFH